MTAYRTASLAAGNSAEYPSTPRFEESSELWIGRVTQVIVTTPEKWDVITRKSSDVALTSMVRSLAVPACELTAATSAPGLGSPLRCHICTETRLALRCHICPGLARAVTLRACELHGKEAAQVRLLIIDEVHLLNDERGPVSAKPKPKPKHFGPGLDHFGPA